MHVGFHYRNVKQRTVHFQFDVIGQFRFKNYNLSLRMLANQKILDVYSICIIIFIIISHRTSIVRNSHSLDLQLPWLEATCIHCELASLTWYYVHLITLLSTLRLSISAFIREPFGLKYNLFSVLHDPPIAISTN